MERRLEIDLPDLSLRDPAPTPRLSNPADNDPRPFIDTASEQQTDHTVPVETWAPDKRELLLLMTLSLNCLLVAIDATVIVTSLPAIARDLRGTATEAYWVGTSYLLTCAVFQPFIGGLSNVFGRQPLLMFSLVLFTLGSVVACAAQNFATLLGGRCVQGIGGGGIIAMSMVIFTDVVPLRYRPKWYGVIQGAWAFGSIFGPLLGGVIAQHTTWRWIFYMNFPLCGIGLVMVLLLVRLKMAETTFKDKLARIDFVGGFFFIAGTTSFLIAVSWGGSQYAWGSSRTLVPLIFGILGTMIAVGWEYRYAAEPFLRRSLFHSTSAIAAYGGSVAQGLLLYGQLYYIPLYFASVKEDSPTMVGVDLFPIVFGLIPSSIVVGMLATRSGHFRWAIWTGWATVVLASGLMIMWKVHTSTGTWVIIGILLGLGHGLVLNVLNFATQATAKVEDAAYAAATYAFMRHFGMALGVGIGSSVFQNIIGDEVQKHGLPDQIRTDAEGYIAVLANLEDGSPFKKSVLHAYVVGIRGVYICLTCIAVVGLALGLLIKSHSLDHMLLSEHTLVKGRDGKHADAEEGRTRSASSYRASS